mgnify:FL=1
MVKFEYRGIIIEAIVETQRYDYKDANNTGRTRFDRNVCVVARFWNFEISNDLYELDFVKSSLNYFMQAYWKRSSKQGSKIELATSLEHQSTSQTLYFTARQKNGFQTLEISLYEQWLPSKQIYLTAQEVIMLDVTIAKAISLLAPETIYINPSKDMHCF